MSLFYSRFVKPIYLFAYGSLESLSAFLPHLHPSSSASAICALNCILHRIPDCTVCIVWAEAQPEPRGWFASTIRWLYRVSSPWHLDPDVASSFLVEELRAARIRADDAERDAQAARSDQVLADERAADAEQRAADADQRAEDAERDAQAARDDTFLADEKQLES
ncbi:hypothetical protein BGZ61DRAFT_534655 [Ilyonectria robusta]|uniref:uncharacterized protein n=1 Tax=Ilyonectria robusta TaxID=1079257 RepID=UPI001E8D78C7|nr:uncharacterized protein BGZ61DRAFT_534655 [Ilyonectria robusta]KAH8683971.1 hypothetical protein BGZ61DRAFT_534655 [Ilyonectria robusta]